MNSHYLARAFLAPHPNKSGMIVSITIHENSFGLLQEFFRVLFFSQATVAEPFKNVCIMYLHYHSCRMLKIILQAYHKIF